MATTFKLHENPADLQGIDIENHVYKDTRKAWSKIPLVNPSSEQLMTALNDTVRLTSNDPEDLRILNDLGSNERTMKRLLDRAEDGKLPDSSQARDIKNLVKDQEKELRDARKAYKKAYDSLNKNLDNPDKAIEKQVRKSFEKLNSFEGLADKGLQDFSKVIPDVKAAEELGIKVVGGKELVLHVHDGKEAQQILLGMVSAGKVDFSKGDFDKATRALESWESKATSEVTKLTKNLEAAYNAAGTRLDNIEKQIGNVKENILSKIEKVTVSTAKAATTAAEEAAHTHMPPAPRVNKAWEIGKAGAGALMVADGVSNLTNGEEKSGIETGMRVAETGLGVAGLFSGLSKLLSSKAAQTAVRSL